MNNFLLKLKDYFKDEDYEKISNSLSNKLRETNSIEDFFIEDKDGCIYIPLPEEISNCGEVAIYEWDQAIIYTKLLKDFQELGVVLYGDEILNYFREQYKDIN
jgi:hypothetical protein